jgi:hypothetical protein
MPSVWLAGRSFDRRFGWARKVKRSEGIRVLGRQALERGFELDEDPVVDEDVESISAVQTQSFVLDRKQLLASDAHPATRELSAYTRFVGGLEQARAQGAIHLDECSDDLLCTVLESSNLAIFLFYSLPSVAAVREFLALSGTSSTRKDPALRRTLRPELGHKRRMNAT